MSLSGWMLLSTTDSLTQLPPVNRSVAISARNELCDRSLVNDSGTVPALTQGNAGRRPVVIDLFSGAGGLSLGFESAGFDVVSAVEYDPVHAATHLFNFPRTDVICRDISTVTKAQLLASAERGWNLHYPGQPWDGQVDVIVGGPSCQGFSTMGKQDAADERNQLILEFVRVVELVRPKAFCMENVPGLLDPRFDQLRTKALERLRQAGYAISGEETVLRAEAFGVPQKRRRVMILGANTSETPPVVPTETTEKPYSVSDAFQSLPQLARYANLGSNDSLRVGPKTSESRTANLNEYLKLVGALGDGSEAFGHAREIDVDLVTGCKITTHTAESISRFKRTPQGKKETISRLYRLSSSAPALTLRAGTGRERGAFSAARPLHPTEPRVITVREAARLHSFPDWFRFHATNWHGHRQVGNAVPPLLAQAAAKSILRALGVDPIKSELSPMPLGDVALLTLSPTEAALLLGASSDQVPPRRRSAQTEVAAA
jgi:DNA (cytosine-5)-methyltransferase 1